MGLSQLEDRPPGFTLNCQLLDQRQRLDRLIPEFPDAAARRSKWTPNI